MLPLWLSGWAWAGLLVTVPAFYLELLETTGSRWANWAYAVAALSLTLVEVVQWRHRPHRAGTTTPPRRWLALALAPALLVAALLPGGTHDQIGLVWRSLTALLTLVYLVWTLQRLLERGSLPVLLSLAVTVLALCGAGFWWLEPNTPTLADGLWLAFTTAATVGYGDVVPSTPASRIFAVFVVLLGFGVLSLVTASVAAMWVQTSERVIEREILQDLHRQVARLHVDLADMKAELKAAIHASTRSADVAAEPPPLHPDRRTPR